MCITNSLRLTDKTLRLGWSSTRGHGVLRLFVPLMNLRRCERHICLHISGFGSSCARRLQKPHLLSKNRVSVLYELRIIEGMRNLSQRPDCIINTDTLNVDFLTGQAWLRLAGATEEHTDVWYDHTRVIIPNQNYGLVVTNAGIFQNKYFPVQFCPHDLCFTNISTHRNEKNHDKHSNKPDAVNQLVPRASDAEAFVPVNEAKHQSQVTL